MARLAKIIFALALASAAADSTVTIDGHSFDGGPCTSEQTQCSDGACCESSSWCCEGMPGVGKVTVNGKTCYQMNDEGQCGSGGGSDAAAPRAGIALLALGALAVAAA